MKWWTFDQDHMDRALKAFFEKKVAIQPERKTQLEEAEILVRAFLYSPEARAEKLRGDNERDAIEGRPHGI